jgi:CheY-like chemotaxis protein
MAQAILSAFGYTVIAVRSGKAALEEFEAVGGKVDMVLTDLVMPGMGGRELADELTRRKPGLKLVTMSGFIRGGTNTDDAFLQKPFTAQDLLRRVRTGLA